MKEPKTVKQKIPALVYLSMLYHSDFLLGFPDVDHSSENIKHIIFKEKHEVA